MSPIEKKHRDMMNRVAAALDEGFKPHGFCLLVFDLNSTDGRMNYISNAERGDMLVALKEFIANCEGRVPTTSGAKQ